MAGEPTFRASFSEVFSPTEAIATSRHHLAVSSSIKAREASYNVQLFDRVGRRVELTAAGRLFLDEARGVLSRANAAALVLSELGGLKRGILNVLASQTIANYWLPQQLMRFYGIYPQVEVRLTVGNTQTVAQAVMEGVAEIGFIEGVVDEPALAATRLAEDQMVIVVSADHPCARHPTSNLRKLLSELSWVVREKGSGTRSEFETALKSLAIDPSELQTAMVLPSNEAVLSALKGSRCAAAMSKMAVASMIETDILCAIDTSLPPRAFTLVRHKQRVETAAAGSCASSALWRISPRRIGDGKRSWMPAD